MNIEVLLLYILPDSDLSGKKVERGREREGSYL